MKPAPPVTSTRGSRRHLGDDVVVGEERPRAAARAATATRRSSASARGVHRRRRAAARAAAPARPASSSMYVADEHPEAGRRPAARPTCSELQAPLPRNSRSSPACVQRQRSSGAGWYTCTPCVEARTRPPGAVTRRSSRTACGRVGAVLEHLVAEHEVEAARPRPAGRSTRAEEVGVADGVDGHVLGRAPANNGRYGFDAAADVEDAVAPALAAPPARPRRAASAASGARTAYVERAAARPAPVLAASGQAPRDGGGAGGDGSRRRST